MVLQKVLKHTHRETIRPSKIGWRYSFEISLEKTFGNYKRNKEERCSRVPRLSDTRYSAKSGTKGKWRYASNKARLKSATYRR